MLHDTEELGTSLFDAIRLENREGIGKRGCHGTHWARHGSLAHIGHICKYTYHDVELADYQSKDKRELLDTEALMY